MAWSTKKTATRAKATKKTKYSAAEKLAFATGKAYKLGKEGKKIKFKNPSTKAAFCAGYKKDTSKYEKIENR